MRMKNNLSIVRKLRARPMPRLDRQAEMVIALDGHRQ